MHKCRCAHSGTLACTCAQVCRYTDTHIFHTCGGDRNTCTRAQEYMTPAQTRVQMHKHACTSTRRCPDKEADVLRYSPTCTTVHTHSCTPVHKERTRVHTATQQHTFRFICAGAFRAGSLFRPAGNTRWSSAGRGTPAPGKSCAGAATGWGWARRSFPGDSHSELFGLAGSSGCCLVNFIIAASLLFV